MFRRRNRRVYSNTRRAIKIRRVYTATKYKKIPLGNQELEKATGGAGYNEQQWAEWTKAWKDWWIEHYGDIICPKCHMPMLNAIVTYDKDLAYDCYMNNALMCKCGNACWIQDRWR